MKKDIHLSGGESIKYSSSVVLKFESLEGKKKRIREERKKKLERIFDSVK